MRVVVTGGAGFIGANLCRVLGDVPGVSEVVVIDDLSTGFASNLDGLAHVELVQGTILDADVLDKAFVGAEAVVHLAARSSVPRSLDDPVATHAANATGTLEVLEAARRAGAPYVVLASSSSVYGANPAQPKSEDLTPMPMSPYAVSKLAGESYALAHATCFDLPVLALRFFNVFGPLQAPHHTYAAVVPAFIDAALARRPLPVYGDGLQTRDFTYVDSVAGVLVDAVTRRVVSPRPVNLAFGTRVTLLELIAELEAILGHRLDAHHLPPRAGDVRASQADQTRLHALFPEARRVDLATGLRATLEWFRSTGSGAGSGT
ncbi:MAG TPA: NAD-dependent epimerase/dehydratase family protein [Acidimicrobiales bacterium]|nr:NAD-dependent epimerase/dehydratase family protein [Acidimicrobiales bacterium]